MSSANAKTSTPFLTLGRYIKRNWRGLFVSLVLGGTLGVGGLLFLQNYNPPDDAPHQASIVFGQIVKQNEMVSASQYYMITDKNVDKNKIGSFELPFTENSFWYRYIGTIKAGVDLETARYEMPDEYTIVVSLYEPYIMSNEPDMERSGVLEENNNLLLNPIHVDDVDAFQRVLKEQSQQYAYENGIIEEARTNAEINIRNMFLGALGDEYTVSFVWLDPEAPSESVDAQADDAGEATDAAEGDVEPQQ